MTAIATPTSQALSEWTKVFPKQITENYTCSVTFMKQLTVIALSTITYLRNAFPEESYSLENFAGVKLRILKKKCRDELAHFVSTALNQAFEAFDKKYLHQLALCFYEDECKLENLIEYHVFEYTYNSDGVTMSIHSKTRDSARQSTKYTFNGVRDRTILLIRACVVIMESYKSELPESYDVSIRLYYNDDAPEGYQAPGFNSSTDTEDHLETTFSESIKLGYVDTPYHRLVARSYVRDTMGSSHEAIPSQNPPMMTQMEQEEFHVPLEKGAQPTAFVVRCPCNKNEPSHASDEPMLLCQYCGTYQHATCFGLLCASGRPHCCELCSERDPRRAPADARLAAATARKRECLCVFRRTLALCARCTALSGNTLSSALGVSASNAAKLLKLLHSHGIIDHNPNSDFTTMCNIVSDRLKSIMSQYFQETEEENIVDRLLAETILSQEQPDPIGDVLGPLEKVSLQNASNNGMVIENVVPQPEIEDLTLKQYKEALFSNYHEDDELPDSGSHDPIKDIEKLGKRTAKRKVVDPVEEGKPRLRTGVRTKRAKIRE